MSIRLRLTLLYGGLVLACGIALLGTVYFLMRYVPDYAPAQRLSEEEHLVTVPAVSTPPDAIISKDDVLVALLRVSGVALIGLALVALVLGWLIAGRMLAPVHRITRTAGTVAGHTLDERIRLDGARDEFTELADTIDTMLDRLHASFQAQQRFAANASHELRTPLTTMRTMLQVAAAHPHDHDLATLAPKLLATNERSIATVEALLALSQAEHGVNETAPVDLTSVAERALEEVHEEAAACRISVRGELRPVRVDGDEDLLHHLLINLLHNAIRHNHTGGAARLTIAVCGDSVVITVANTGEVVTAEDAGRLFEPFYRQRTRTRAKGHGLGLTLVRAVAHSHRGSATAAPNPGGGLTVTVVLPGRGHSASTMDDNGERALHE
ncbi:HAMP domain-containing sensor histidine kinase [Kutzneria viridogrisea]|uniref:histidine kinase n=1 Tax=Kutzneria viridogrisea TaxID=47990 RepID=A0ABR6BKI7_9PSEU|nr:HAMP domain-containing sensor histidine kinase [Kutzneria albida]MBA8927415.1 signal transduction histidine kinase [Kutzneria viridogrisea]